MPDRIIRAELLESDAWLELKDNVDRVAWLACALTVDNFGDMPAGLPRLVRLWRPYGVDSSVKAAKTFADLVDVDLVRRYEVGGKPYLHIPRFRQKLRWIGRAWPLSPWATFEEKQTHAKKYHAEHREPPRSSADHGEKQAEVEVEVEVDKSVNLVASYEATGPTLAVKTPNSKAKAPAKRAARLPADWFLPDAWKDWAVAVHHLDPQRVVRISLAFRDYWIAKPGALGCKLDWEATWRNWVRKECGE